LKCCLNYELDSYLDALKDFPKKNVKLKTKKGTAICQKIDIFKGSLWYAYENKGMDWHELTTEQVKKIIKAEKEAKPVTGLENFSAKLEPESKTKNFENVVGQDSLTRFDRPGKKRKKNKKQNHA